MRSYDVLRVPQSGANDVLGIAQSGANDVLHVPQSGANDALHFPQSGANYVLGIPKCKAKKYELLNFNCIFQGVSKVSIFLPSHYSGDPTALYYINKIYWVIGDKVPLRSLSSIL